MSMRNEEEALLTHQNERRKREHGIDNLKYIPTCVDFKRVRDKSA